MTNAITNIDLAVLHTAIVTDIKAAFPGLVTVEFYREDRKELPKPACLLEMTEMEALPDDDPGTEQQAVMAKFEAELIIGFRTPQAKLKVRLLAASLAAWLRKRKWTNPTLETPALPTGAAEVIGAYPDDFIIMGRQQDNGLDQYEVWRVEWQQIIHLGETVWTNDGTTPTTPLFSWAPEIGPGNEEDYEEALPPQVPAP